MLLDDSIGVWMSGEIFVDESTIEYNPYPVGETEYVPARSLKKRIFKPNGARNAVGGKKPGERR